MPRLGLSWCVAVSGPWKDEVPNCLRMKCSGRVLLGDRLDLSGRNNIALSKDFLWSGGVEKKAKKRGRINLHQKAI